MAMNAHPADDEAILSSFLQRFFADREAGAVLPLAQYQRRFPGYEPLIAMEYERLHAGPAVATAAASDAAAPIRGAAAERYRDDGEVARGGMGAIHRVWDPALRRAVAKKVLMHRGDGASTLLRFLEEAQVMAQLDHPGIVPVHELGVDAQNRHYFTMPLVRGEDFGVVIDRVQAGDPAWTQARALGVLQRVCDTVAFAHEKGVIHRDLKPANIMVGRFGEAYVLDWGLASVQAGDDPPVEPLPANATGVVRSARHELREQASASPFLTHAGDVVGTPAYMAPEQASGDVATIGPCSDVHALGAILYHLVAGRMPYGDQGSTTWQQVLDASRAGAPTPLRSLAPKAPAELLAICDKAMARDPRARYATAKALGQDLRNFLEGRVVGAHATGALVELRKWIQRNRLAATAAAIAVLSLVGGLGVSVHLGREADAQAQQAEAGYLGALDAVETMFNRVVESDLKHLPGAENVRRGLMTDAARLLERFVAERAEQPGARFRLGKTYGQLATIHGVLGDAERQAAHWAEAERVFTALARETPDSPEVGEKLAYARMEMAREAARGRRTDDALRLLATTAADLDRLLARHPRHAYLAYRRALCDDKMALVHRGVGSQAEAGRHVAAAVAAYERLLDLPDCDTNMRLAFVNAAFNRVIVAIEGKDEATATTLLARARHELAAEEAAGNNPREVLHQLARTHSVESQMALHRQDWTAAGDAIARGLPFAQRLTTDFPFDPGNWFLCSVLLYNRAVVEQKLDDTLAALATAEQALTAARRALAGAPGDRGYHNQCRLCLTNRLFVLRALGQHTALSTAAEELLAFDPEHAEGNRNAGSFLCAAAAMAAEDPALPAAERERLHDRHLARGVECLRKAFALAGGNLRWFDGELFDGVRTDPSFTALLDELRARATDGVVPSPAKR